ncbi:MAG: nucleotidyltransferase [Bacteroidetes bacterium]|nr:nucleotidyltransferase [Bacteroidota bacterium]
MNLSVEQKKQFSDILEELGKTLDVTETQYEAAVKSYQFVAEWLSKDDSPIAQYSPEILPQGSFLLQTMIKPIHEEDELDIDLVCKLEKIRPGLTQFNLKHLVGDRLKANGTLDKLLVKPDGRRCWTLQYAETAKFHLDILPSVVAEGYKTILEKAFSATNYEDTQSLGIRITDNTSSIYKTSTNLLEWMKSNPFGYAIWFQNRCKTSVHEVRMMSEAIQPVPKFQKNKFPLQRVVQILKRHRDMMFNGDDDKPISIIITTLAAKAYNKEVNIIEALVNVIDKMPNYIEERKSTKTNKTIKWIANPVNEQENFADKWEENPKRQENFYNWLRQVKVDINNVTGLTGSHRIMESLSNSFGKTEVTKAFSNLGKDAKLLTENGNNRFDTKLGIMTGAANPIKPHNFYGTED